MKVGNPKMKRGEASINPNGRYRSKLPISQAHTFLYNTYRYGAKKREINFDLDKAYFIDLTSKNCHYCGSSPTNSIHVKNYPDHPYKYNGIDRQVNSLGYVKGNVVTCCRRCNFAKKDSTYDDFIAWLRQVAVYVGLSK